jgi:hypothetical protein
VSVDDRRLSESNWRPTRSSTVVSAAVAAVVTLGLAAIAGATAPAALGFLAGLCLAGTLRATALAERRVATILAGVLAVVAGLASIGGAAVAVVMQVGWPPTPPLPFLEFAPFALVVAGSLAGVGGLAAFWGVSPGADAGTAAGRVLVAATVPVAVLSADLLAPMFEPVFRLLGLATDVLFVRGAAAPTGLPRMQLVVSFVGAAVAAVAVRSGVGALPISELAGEDTEAERAAAVATTRRLLAWVGIVAGLSALGVAFALVAAGLSAGLYPRLPPVARSLFAWLGASTALRWLFVVLTVASIGTFLGVRLLRSAASERFRPDFLPVASLSVGGLLVVAVWMAHPTVARRAIGAASSDTGRRLLRNLFETLGTFAVVLGVVCIGLAVAVLPLLALSIAGRLRLLGETTGAQLAAAGTLTAAVAAAIADLSILFVVGGVAASLLVWDLGEFAATLGRELGRQGSTRRGELVHAGGAVLLAAVASVVAVGTVRAVYIVPPTATTSAVAATVTAVAGTLLLLVLAR